MTKVINIKSGEKYDVYCGRTGNGQNGYFGNPHVIGYCKLCNRYHDRTDSIETFRQEFISRVNRDKEYKDKIIKLKNKILGCFCKERDKEIPCHCDIYLDYLDHPEKYLSNKISNQNKKYKIAVIGSRSVQDRKIVFDYLDSKQDKIEMIISGGCSGPDDYSAQWAKERGFPILIYWPKWRDKDNNYDAGAGFKRNNLIIKSCDYCIAFWDMESRGTANSLEWCKKLNKPVKIIECKITNNKKEETTHDLTFYEWIGLND